jgi:hypothetical protein
MLLINLKFNIQLGSKSIRVPIQKKPSSGFNKSGSTKLKLVQVCSKGVLELTYILMLTVLRILDPVPLLPGSGIGKKSGSGSRMKNPDLISVSLEAIFWVKIL